ncbi:MAG TPA: GntR family transcriptional regulator [Acidimicrobiales bacterium]|nr:GntR family transcriptional regulator [Acidimicrobiales bacterium]
MPKRKSNLSAVWDRRSSGQRVALYIRSLIFEGELRSGDRVPQDEIAAALGLSRLPVREAIIALEHEGLLTIEPHRGVFINPLTPDTLRDQYELFGANVGIAVRLAARRGGEAFIEDLSKVHARMAAASDADEFDKASDEFQSLIIATADSPRLRAVLRVLAGIVPGNFFVEVPGALEIQSAGLAAMMNALRQHDSGRAADEYLRMMRSQAEAVVGLLTRRGFFSEKLPD